MIEHLFLIIFFHCLEYKTSILIVIKVNAVRANNGIAINSNQLMYSELQGTPLTQGLIPPKPGTLSFHSVLLRFLQ